jgi:glycosyltransferase involved in cell wall biosynthesis
LSRIMYLDTYTENAPEVGGGVPSSSSIGYGVTASGPIQRELHNQGFEVVRGSAQPKYRRGDGRQARLRWVIDTYSNILDLLDTSPPDLIFAFHIFSVFPVEIRRMLVDQRLKIPIVGYTHGSHWDFTDTYRFEKYPGLELADLANLHVLDRLFLVSDYMRTTLTRNIKTFQVALGEEILAKSSVVGLPIDVERIDHSRTTQKFPRPTIVFNHSPIASKNPDLFARVMQSVMSRYAVNVLFTRKVDSRAPGAQSVVRLAQRFGDRVLFGNDMPLDKYYEALWMSDIQVSTATHESLGISTLEAMYTQNCCILPRLGSYPEICGNHPDVLYELNEKHLKERLAYFIERPSRRQSVALELRRIAAKYNAAEVVQRIVQSIASLC